MIFKEFANLSAVAFKTSKNHYIYDRFSNKILKVDPAIIDVLDDSFRLTKDQIAEKHESKFPRCTVLRALNSIARSQKTQKALIDFEIPRLSISRHNSIRDTLNQKLNGHLTQLTINVTENCNFRCKYCVYSGAYSKRRTHNKFNDISENMAKKAVDFFYAHSRDANERYLSFYGGEPLLRFGFVKNTIEYARQIDPAIGIAITSNGTQLNDEMIRFFDSNNVALTISLDGPKKIHDNYRVYANGRGTFDSIMRNIQMIKKKYPSFYSNRLKISAVIVPHSGDMAEMEKFFKKTLADFREINQKFFIGLINPEENSFIGKHDYNKYIAGFFSLMYKKYVQSHTGAKNVSDIMPKALLAKQMKMLYYRSNQCLAEYDLFWPNGICIPGMRSLFVSSDGRFYPCEKLYDYDDMVIGNIDSGFNVGRIEEIITEYCQYMIEDCKRCWVFRLCSECFLTIRSNKTWDSAKRKEFCAGQKNMWIRMLIIYTSIIENDSDAFDYFWDESRNELEYVKEMTR